MPGRTALPTSRVLEVMKEVGTARLDDLAEFLGYHRATVQRKADELVARGELTLASGIRGEGQDREYAYGDGSPEQGMAEAAEVAA